MNAKHKYAKFYESKPGKPPVEMHLDCETQCHLTTLKHHTMDTSLQKCQLCFKMGGLLFQPGEMKQNQAHTVATKWDH